jgi:hypothetical protein
MKHLTLFLFLCFLSFLHTQAANYVPAKIYLRNGTVKSGLANLLNSNRDKTVKFKTGESSSDETILATDISSLIYSVGEEEYAFEYLKNYKFNNKTLAKETWHLVMLKGFVTLYISGFSDMKVKKADLIFTFVETKYYTVRRKDEQVVTILVLQWLQGGVDNNYFLKRAKDYFSDYPDLVEKLDKKEFSWEDVGKIVTLYNEWKDKKTKKK